VGHDQLFKDLLRAFFGDFLALFLPNIAAGIDPESIRFLDPQTFTDVPQGQLRTADLAAELRTLGGDPEVVLVHTEVQSELEDVFSYRMWEYHALLRLRTSQPVISVALLPFTGADATAAEEAPAGRRAGEAGIRLARYSETLFGQEYTHLDYWEIRLRDLPADAYVQAEPVLGPTLASLMRTGAGGKPALKLAVVERLRASGLDEARLFLAVNFMETYLELDEEEQAIYQARLQAEHGL
jgi:hypothetical protein